jgi:hypothetical protein
MNASLLSALQSEPWSLVFLGAALFALSAMARRRVMGIAARTAAISPDAGTGLTVKVPGQLAVAKVNASRRRSFGGRLRSRIVRAA